ncbi:MAG: hypothetical protein FRX49_01405 [Trebouxia sp. A1-2]|nr:MAG: hypothetical protein FRX49_01405 [Trebouxia sp. A1-2]
MTLTTNTGAVSLLAHLALADPYTALDSSHASDLDDAQRSLDTAASVNVATAEERGQVTGLKSSAATQSPVSTLQMLQQLIESPSSHSTSQKHGIAKSGYQLGAAAVARTVVQPASDWQIIGEFCSRTVSRKWLRLVMHGWHQAIKSKVKWRCIEQELLLRQCRAALHGWHRTATLESKRAHMLADHVRKEHILQTARSSFMAWRKASEVATAQSSFIIQSLAAPERAVLTAALRGWKARCQLRHRANAFSFIAAQAASRWRLRQTVQRVYLQRLLQAWHMRASNRVQLKIVAFASWKQALVWQQRKPLLLCTALSHYERRQASGMLIAARHRQLLAATAVQAFHQHAQLRKTKYAMWRAAARQRLCTLFRGLHRGCAVSKQQQCMHELAVMFHWASRARTCLWVWQKYAECSATKKNQWDASMMRKMQAILQGWCQLVLHKREAEAVLLRHCLEAWAAIARKAGLLRFLLIEHAAVRQGQQKGAVLDAWRQLLLSRAAVAVQGDHTKALRSCSLATVDHLDDTLLQKAVQGWHAVVIHMARRRAQSQQAALASAERAVRKGCQAAAGSLLHRVPSDQVGTGQSGTKLLWQTNAAYQQKPESCAQDLDVRLLTLTSHQQMLSHRQHDSLARDDLQTSFANNGSCSLTSDCGRAQKGAQAPTQYAASLLARAVKAWQTMTIKAVALLFQQHELKAEANRQILQASSNRQLVSRGQAGKGSKGSSDKRKSLMKALARTTPTRAPTIPANQAQSEPAAQPPSTGITYSVLPATSPTAAATVAMEPAQAVRVLQPLPGCTNQPARCCPVPELHSQDTRLQHALGSKMVAAQAQPAEQVIPANPSQIQIFSQAQYKLLAKG